MPACDRGRPWEGPAYDHCKHWSHGDMCCWCDEADGALREVPFFDHEPAWHSGGVCTACGAGRDFCLEEISGFGP